MPTVSVILAAHNRVDLLYKSMASVLAQSYQDFELIIVDDASHEDIESVAQSFNDVRIRYLRRSQQGGPAAARNSGLQIARGTYVAFQDDDDEWLLDKLALQVAALTDETDETDETDDCMCLCGLIRFSGRVRPYPTQPWPTHTGFAEIASQPRAYTQTWLVPRTALLAEHGFDERLWLWEDWELLLRLSRRLRICTLNPPLVISTQTADSISHDNHGFLRSMNLILQKHDTLFARHPHLLAKLLYVQARLLIGDGQLPAARHSLRRSLMLDRRRIKPWQLLAISYLGRAFVLRRFTDAAGLREIRS